MKDSIKANLIIFFIIAVIAFCISTAFASITVKEDADSYKLIPIEDDGFQPNSVEEVPYIEPTPVNVTNNTTNTTNNPSYNTTNSSGY